MSNIRERFNLIRNLIFEAHKNKACAEAQLYLLQEECTHEHIINISDDYVTEYICNDCEKIFYSKHNEFVKRYYEQTTKTE